MPPRRHPSRYPRSPPTSSRPLTATAIRQLPVPFHLFDSASGGSISEQGIVTPTLLFTFISKVSSPPLSDMGHSPFLSLDYFLDPLNEFLHSHPLFRVNHENGFI